MTVNEGFDLGILEIGEIAGQFVVDSIDDHDPHVELKQEIEPIGPPTGC